MDMYDQFVGMVAAGRHMEPDAVRALADGRAYTGRQALKLGLIDAIGDEQDAKAWLETDKGSAQTSAGGRHFDHRLGRPRADRASSRPIVDVLVENPDFPKCYA